MRKKATRAEALEFLHQMCIKYDKLVWYARKPQEWLRDGHPSMPGMVEVQMKYPDECEALAGEDGDWEHGFNSGCLATLRLVIDLIGQKKKYFKGSLEDFPQLDT